MLLTDYLDSWTQELYEQRLLSLWTADLTEGIHPMQASAERSYDPGECLIDGQEMEQVRLDVDFGVQVLRPAVISDYEVSLRYPISGVWRFQPLLY